MKKRVLVCLHGFMNDVKHDLNCFKEYFDSQNSNEDFQVILANLYNPLNPKTYKHKMMYKRVYMQIKKLIDEGYEVNLLAYSFSAGIGAHLCKTLPIKRFVLVGPTVYLVKTKLLKMYLNTAYKHVKLWFKYGKKAAKIMERMKTKGVVRLSYNIALSIFRERKYFRGIHCDTFIVKGANDQFCIDQTLSMITKRVKRATVYSKIYPERDHYLVFALDRGQDAFDDIIAFAFYPECADKFLE